MNGYLVEIRTYDFALAYEHQLKAGSMDQAQALAEIWMVANGYPLHKFYYVIEQTSGIREAFPFPL